ncbi:MAG: hypothetical protein ACRC0R_00130 [Cetobacterium sp.]
MELIRIIEQLNKKMADDKQKLAEAKAQRNSLKSRASELGDELMQLLNTDNLKEAFTKLYKLTELETRLEKVMEIVLECYNTGELSKMVELNPKIEEITKAIEKIKNEKHIDVESEEPISEPALVEIVPVSVEPVLIKELKPKKIEVPTKVLSKPTPVVLDEDDDLID